MHLLILTIPNKKILLHPEVFIVPYSYGTTVLVVLPTLSVRETSTVVEAFSCWGVYLKLLPL